MTGEEKKLAMAHAIGTLEATGQRVKLDDYCDEWISYELDYHDRGDDNYNNVTLWHMGTFGIEKHCYCVIRTNVGLELNHVIALIMMGIDIFNSELRKLAAED